MLESILESTTELTITNLLILSFTSIILGFIIAFIHMKTNEYNKNFIITLSIIPILVQTVILMVNGNLGTSIAIAGAFSLIRFRSVPGTSKEIISIFFATAIGLAMGMGQILFAIIITIIVSITLLLLSKLKLIDNNYKILKITIPEDLDYTNLFDDIFTKYNIKATINNVKTINLGSLFEITYKIKLNDNTNEKELIDDLRCRNGNLKIILTHPINNGEL